MYLKNIIVPACVSFPFLLIPTIPMGTCWRGTTQKRSQQRNGFASPFLGIPLVSSHEVGPVTSYKWNCRAPTTRGEITPGKPIYSWPFIGLT